MADHRRDHGASPRRGIGSAWLGVAVPRVAVRRVALLGAALLGATLTASCDLPPPRTSRDGPRILAITPPLTEGELSRGVSWRVELDRRIAPNNLYQGVVEVTSNDVYVFVDMSLDVVHPAILVTPIGLLDPEVGYDFVVRSLVDLEGLASADTDPVRFHTSTERARVPVPPITYDDVAPVLARCASTDCHGGAHPAVDLDLSSAAGLRATAVGVAARAVAPGGGGSLPRPVTAALLGMPRIAAGDPGRSYLLYTMVGDEHIAGNPMPPDAPLFPDEEIDLVQRWIRQGTPGI